MADKSAASILAEIDGLIEATKPGPLTPGEEAVGLSRSYLSGPTLNFNDEIEAIIASPFTGRTYADELAKINDEQNNFNDQHPIVDTAVSVGSGMALNPFNWIKSLMVGPRALSSLGGPASRTASNLLLNPAVEAGVAGAGSAQEGESRLGQAGVSALVGGATSAVGGVVGDALGRTGKEADRLKLSAYGVKNADISSQIKKMSNAGIANLAGNAGTVPLVRSIDRFEQAGIITATDDVLENLGGIHNAQHQIAGELNNLILDADQVVQPFAGFQTTNADRFIAARSGTARVKAQTALNNEMQALQSQIGTGTLRDLQDAKIGLNYKWDENPYSEDIIKALRSDLREEIETRVNHAASQGLLAPQAQGAIRTLNREYGDLSELFDAFKKGVASKYGGNVVEDVVGSLRTSGGSGSLNIMSAVTGNPVFAAGGMLLNAARSTGALSAISDAARTFRRPLVAAGDALPEILTGRAGSQVYNKVREPAEQPSRRINFGDIDPAQADSLLAEIDGMIGNSEKKNETADVAIGEDMKAPSPKFLEKVDLVASELETDPQALLQVMRFETGGTLDPKEKNRAGSGATGLIQFTPATAQSLLSTETKEQAIKKLEGMTDVEQLDFVQKHLQPFKGKLNSIDDLYMAVLYPKAVGKDGDFTLFEKGSKAYWQNRGLDLDKDGRVTKEEAASKVRNA